MADLIKCAKCGACTSVCPVYQITGHESLTARGRIHLLAKLTSKKQSSHFSEIFSKCLLCGACYQACPRNIDTPALIIQAREEYSSSINLGSFQKLLIQKSLSRPALLPVLKAGGHLLAGFLPKDSGLRLKLALFETTTLPPNRSFIESLQLKNDPLSNSNKVAYFTGCLANYLQQNIAEASVTCLKKLCNTLTIAPKEQTCCGMAATAAGAREDAISLAKKNIAVFQKPPYLDLPIFTSCATCYAQLKSYPDLLAAEPAWHTRAKDFASLVYEFSTYLLSHVDQAVIPKIRGTKQINVFYHDPCHLRFPKHNEAKVISEPRKLLSMFPKITVKELPNGPHCCGQGGLFHISHPETSNQICGKLLSDCDAPNVQIVATTCSGCLMQIHEGLARIKSETKAIHLASLLNEYLKSS